MSGYPCNEFLGYCDTLNKCRPVGPLKHRQHLHLQSKQYILDFAFQYNPEGALQQLRDLFSSEGLRSIADWFKDSWYIPVAVVVGFIIMLVSFTHHKI